MPRKLPDDLRNEINKRLRISPPVEDALRRYAKANGITECEAARQLVELALSEQMYLAHDFRELHKVKRE